MNEELRATVRSNFLHSSFVVLCLAIAAAAPAADRPDLVVVISIDQFRYEYLTRFYPYFAPDGFRRFIDRGADFTNAYYPYATTFTGPGHAAIGTGYTPSENGIVGNDWWDRNTNTEIYCAGDRRAAGGFSPVNLQSDSLGDRLQERYPGARVYGVAIKDRAAILMAGRKATTAYWFEPKTGFTSSSFYQSHATLMSAFNATLPKYLAEHPQWTQSSFIPAADLARVTHDPPALRKYKSDREGLGVAFPHPIRSIDALTYTPFGNALVIDFAERLIETENLGREGAASPDLLFVGLSSPDYLGHYFGPDSLEVADSAVRTDRDIAGFLAWLDARAGNRYTVAITADHGVQSIPEVAKDMGREAGRVSLRNARATMVTLADLATIAPERIDIERRAAAALGRKFNASAPLTDALILVFEEPALYLNWTHVAAMKLDGERVKRAIRDAALKVQGVSAAFTNTELLAPNPTAAGIELAVRRSFRADRTGDVIITLKPGYIWASTIAATHGQPVEDDQHVPVMLWGRGIRPKQYGDRVAPTDLAKSIGALFGFDAGGQATRILPCIAASEVKQVLLAALAKSPKYEHLIAGANLSPDVRTAIEFAQPPAEGLPEGYARVDRIEIEGDTATVALWYGPIPPPPPPGVVQLACGTGYTYALRRNANGQWEVKTFGVSVC